MSARHCRLSVEKATGPHLVMASAEHRTLVNQACQLLSQSTDGGRAGISALHTRLQSQNPVVQLLALELVERVVEMCGIKITQKIAEEDFMNVLVRILQRERLDKRVELAVLDLVAKLANDFAHESDIMPGFKKTYEKLKQQGYRLAQRKTIYDGTFNRGVDAELVKRLVGMKETANILMDCIKKVSAGSKSEAVRDIAVMCIKNSKYLQRHCENTNLGFLGLRRGQQLRLTRIGGL